MLLKPAALLLAASLATAHAATLSLTEKQVEEARRGSAEARLESGAIRLRFDNPRGDSGIRLRPPEGQAYWDLSGGKILTADVENLSADKQLRLTLHISSGKWGEKTFGRTKTGIALNPGEKRTMHLPLLHRATWETPEGIRTPRVLDTDKINWIEFFMEWPFEGPQPGLVDCRISNLRLDDAPAGSPLAVSSIAPVPRGDKFFPFIDIYGQYKHADWPEKIHTDADLKKAHQAELTELAASTRPAEWNRYGGWANGPRLEATGNFRTEKYEGKWWLVDPEGRLFFSQGIDVLIAHTDATKSTGHEKWFDFPVKTADLPFTGWNLQKKYGQEDYAAAFYETLTRRLEAWGINTIGNWGKADLILLGKTPYTLQLTDYNRNLPRVAGSKLKFYDVFDPAYARAMKTLISDRAASRPEVMKSLTDPMCIGYFIDNELNFGNRGSRQTFTDDVLKSPAKQAAKREFVDDLRVKYVTIDNLNKSWETDYADWAALLNRTVVPKSGGYRTDADAFFEKAVNEYFRLCQLAVKGSAPHRLYLGTRFIATDATRKVLFEASQKHCDILTLNIYAPGTANLRTEGFPDMPVLIGEFHFGIFDRGLFSASLTPAGITQQERALAYTRFLQGALAHPNIVGTHWFQFRDQPLTGRWDGEGYPIGFVDVADTPYPEMTRASREVGEGMYHYRERGKLLNPMK
ncbi:hypothetical protein OpiT1DRAFT_04525 [Opitutaceae bacterium TAV1]|nr:hypothetical protein OpiT1DRAFT_04525 [Opitutaceae bacterium TAV1]